MKTKILITTLILIPTLSFADNNHQYQPNEKISVEYTENFHEETPKIIELIDQKLQSGSTQLMNKKYKFADQTTYRIFLNRLASTTITLPKDFVFDKILSFTNNLAINGLSHNQLVITMKKGQLGFATLRDANGSVISFVVRSTTGIDGQLPYLTVEIK